MYDILARAFIVFILVLYSALLIPLVVWALKDRLGGTIITRLGSGLVRVSRRARFVICQVRDVIALRGWGHGCNPSETGAHH
jgi:hypothetical protein